MARPSYEMMYTRWQNGLELGDNRPIPGRGRVLACIGPASSGRPGYYKFKCNCNGKGSTFEARGSSVRSGNTRSCGCMRRGPSSDPSAITPKKRKPRKIITYAEMRTAGGDLIVNALAPLFEERGIVITKEQVGSRINIHGQSVPQWQYWYAVQPHTSKRIGPFEHTYNLIGHVMLHAVGRIEEKAKKAKAKEKPDAELTEPSV